MRGTSAPVCTAVAILLPTSDYGSRYSPYEYEYEYIFSGASWVIIVSLESVITRIQTRGDRQGPLG